MPRRTEHYLSLGESGWTPDDRMREYCAKKYPTMDVDETFELFSDNALSHDKVFADWAAAFRTWLRNGAKYGGLVFKQGLADPKFAALIQRARGIGFRDPLPSESPGVYRTALDNYDRESARTGVARIATAIRRIP